ncbi:MAG: hypothetical protein ABIL09_00975 [Gemmatimonadota bacterium]
MVGDSEVPFAELEALEDNAGRPESAAARQGALGRGECHSTALGRQGLYVAHTIGQART